MIAKFWYRRYKTLFQFQVLLLYLILFHIYIDEAARTVSDVGFEVLISVKNKHKQITTTRLYDYIKTAEWDLRNELYKKNVQAVNAFLNTSFSEIEPEDEYRISTLMGKASA